MAAYTRIRAEDLWCKFDTTELKRTCWDELLSSVESHESECIAPLVTRCGFVNGPEEGCIVFQPMQSELDFLLDHLALSYNELFSSFSHNVKSKDYRIYATFNRRMSRAGAMKSGLSLIPRFHFTNCDVYSASAATASTIFNVLPSFSADRSCGSVQDWCLLQIYRGRVDFTLSGNTIVVQTQGHAGQVILFDPFLARNFHFEEGAIVLVAFYQSELDNM